jgi:hypothetical protein
MDWKKKEGRKDRRERIREGRKREVGRGKGGTVGG